MCKNILVLVLVLFAISCKKGPDHNFVIDGKLDNLSKSELILVRNYSVDSLVIDTLKVGKNGTFNFSGNVDKPIAVTLFYHDLLPPFRFFIDKDYSVLITGDVSAPMTIDIIGGVINDDLNQFWRDNSALLSSRLDVITSEEPEDPTHFKNVDLQLSRVVREYVSKNPSKLASVILMDEFAKGVLSSELLSKDIESLEGAAADYYLTTSLKKYNDKSLGSRVGVLAPQIELESTKGNMVKLTDFRGKNVLLIFDLKDAPTNQRYFDHLKEAYRKLDKKVEFLVVVVDENIKNPSTGTLKAANTIDWPVLLDCKMWNSEEAIKYNITSLPYMILISPDGLIVERDVSLDSLVNNIDKYNIK